MTHPSICYYRKTCDLPPTRCETCDRYKPGKPFNEKEFREQARLGDMEANRLLDEIRRIKK
jgi:hypothetical protein